MKIGKWPYAIMLFVIVACNQSQTNNAAHDSVTQGNQDTAQSIAAIAMRDSSVLQERTDVPGYLYVVKKEHLFSNLTNKDIFELQVRGDDFLNAKTRFTITTSQGKLIHEEIFENKSLLDYGYRVGIRNPDTISEATKLRHIKKRLKNFFVESRFRTPAIASNIPFDKNFTSKEIYDEIKADKISIALLYVLGEESGRDIVWSKKSGKVILFYACCGSPF